MELELLELLCFLGIPLLLGSSILRALGLGPRTDPLAYWGWLWMAGALAVAALEVLRLLAGLRAPAFVSVTAIVLALTLRYRFRKAPVVVDEEARPRTGGRIERAFFGLVLVFVLAALAHTFLAASLKAVIATDEGNFWSLRAKYLFDAGGFGGSYAGALAERSFNNANYPLLNSLLQLWVFDCAGGITHVANRLPIQLCGVALVLCSASALRRVSRPWIAGLLLIVLVTCAPLDFGLRRAYSDVLVGLAGLVAIDALQRGASARQPAWFGLASLAVTFLLWSKREGLLLLLACLAAWAFLEWRRGAAPWRQLARWPARWLLPPLVVLSGTWFHNAWLGARGSHEVELEVLTRGLAHAQEGLPLVLGFLTDLAIRPSLHGIPAVFLLLALCLRPRPERASLSYLPLASLIFVLVLGVAMVQGSTAYLIKTAGARTVSQLVPLQLLYIAARLGSGRFAREPRSPSESAR